MYRLEWGEGTDVWRGKEEKEDASPSTAFISHQHNIWPTLGASNLACRQAGGTVRYDTSAGWCVGVLRSIHASWKQSPMRRCP